MGLVDKWNGATWPTRSLWVVLVLWMVWVTVVAGYATDAARTKSEGLSNPLQVANSGPNLRFDTHSTHTGAEHMVSHQEPPVFNVNTSELEAHQATLHKQAQARALLAKPKENMRSSRFSEASLAKLAR